MEEISEDKAILCGVIDPQAEQSGLYAELVKRNVPVYSKIEDFYNYGFKADLVVISSPIHFHVRQSIIAMQNGSNVLCDKPVGTIVQDVLKLIEVKDNYNMKLSIGYQWSFTNAIQNLKKDILNNKFGKALLLKSLCFWPRGYDYYSRNNWSGKIKSLEGDWIIDHPANNAFAHFVHNMLFVLGESMSASAVPESIAGELYKAYEIENGDTVCCRILTDRDVDLLFYGSHVTKNIHEPVFVFEFEKATVSLNRKSREISSVLKDGETINYGSPEREHQFLKLFIFKSNFH